LLPKPFEELHNKHIIDVSVGPSGFLAVTKTGAVYSCGYGEHRQVGNSSAEPDTGLTRVNTPAVASGCRIAIHRGHSQVCGFFTVTLSAYRSSDMVAQNSQNL